MTINKFPRSRYLSAAVSAVLSLAAAASAQAAPVNGVVAGGASQGTITHGADTVVDQTASTISISWDSFDVAGGESVTFNQAATDVALNYIGGSSPSQIFGSITADGRVFLMNPNGIVFGLGSQVNVGSLVATSLSTVSETGGVYTFATPAPAGTQPGAITNFGTLTAASGGAIALLGGSVLNTGDVVANLGTVALGVGRAATVSFDAGGLFNFQITSALDANTTGNALVSNSGDLVAEGGQILLTAQQAASVLEQAVNNSGVIRANRVTTGPGGTISLVGDGGAVANTGTLNVSADDGAGGSVQIDGSAVTLGSGASVIAGGSASDGTLQVSSDSTIAAQGTLAVDGTTTLNAGSTVAFNTTSAGTLNVTAGGAITQGGSGITTSGLASFTTRNDAGAAITLNANNSFGSVEASVRNAADNGNAAAGISINEINDTQLAGGLRTAAGQTVSITSGGNITQTGPALTAAGNVSLTAGPARSITLNSANAVTGSIGFDAETVSFTNAGSTALRASTVTNGLTIQSSGSITQTGALHVTGNSTFTADAGQSITLDAANTFTGTVGFVGDGGNLDDVTVRDTTALDLSALTISGDLVATGASLSQSGGLNVGGTATFAADANSTLLFNRTDNALQGAVSFAANGPGALQAVTLQNSVATELGASAVSGAFNVTATAGNITQSGSLNVGGNLALTATAGGISQTAAMNVTGNSTFTAANGQSVLLGQANTFTGSVGFAGNGGNLANVTVRDSNALTLQAPTVTNDLTATATSIDAQALTVGGNLNLTATTGDITQSAAMNVTGNSTFTAAAGRSITLDAANTFTGTVGFAGDGGNLANVTVRDATALNLQPLNVSGNLTATAASLTSQALTVGGNLALTATSGDIAQTAAMSVAGNSTFTANTGRSILLDQANTFTGSVGFVGNGGNLANVTVRDSNALILQTLAIDNDLTATAASIEAQGLTVGGNLNLTATTGGITQTAAMNVTGNSTFTADAGQSILLGQANTFTGGVGFVGNGGNLNDITLRDSNAVELQALALDGDLIVTTTSGTITQAGALEIGGTSTFTAATGQSISLVDTGNDFTGIVTFLGSGGNLANVSVRDTSALTLGGLTLSGNLSVNADSIAQSGALIIGGDSTFTASGGQSIDLDNSGNTFTGTVGFAARSGTLQDVSIADTTTLDLQALTIGGDLTASATNLTQSGALSIGGAATLTSNTAIALNTTSADSLTVNAGGAVTQAGDLTIANATTINAGGQNVSLTGANNNFGGSVAITAATAALTNSTATTLAASTLGSSLTVNSTGAISQAGALTVTGGSTALNSNAGVALGAIDTGTLTINAGGDVAQPSGILNVSGNTNINAAGRNVTLTSANMLGSNVAIAAANATLTNGGATALGASTIANSLTVNSAGAITQGGALAVGGLSTFNASGQDVTLTAGNSLGGGIALTANTATLTNTVATTLQASTVSGDLTVNSGGAVAQSGALNVGGATAVGAAGQNVSLGDVANQFGGGVAVTGANVTVVDADSIDLRASTVSGDLAVTAVAGTITQSGALNVAGSSTFTAADGQSILLNDATNVFGGVRLASSGRLDDVSLAAASGLDLQGLDIAGDLAVTSGGSLTQSGALVVAGDADFRTLNSGSNIVLNGANQFGSVSAMGAGGVSITQGAGDLNLRQVTAAGAARLEASAGSIVDDAVDPSVASVSAASVELLALNNIGAVTDLLTRQGAAIAVNTNGGALAARVASTNGQINLALPGGSATTAAAGAISAGGSGRLLIQSAGDLSLNAFNAAITGFSDIGFSADGALSMPGAQSDLISGPLTTFYLRGATDIARADRTFNLSASHLIFDSGSQGGDVTLNTSANRLDASVGAGASLTVQNTGDLTLGTISAGNNVTLSAANLRDDGDAGGVTRVTAANTITLNASAAIGEADGTGAGRIDTASNSVALNAGAVYLSHAGDLQVSGNAAAGAIDIVAPTGNITVASTLRANGPLTLLAGMEGAVNGNIALAGSAQSTGAATLTAANGGTITDANDAATHLTAQTANLTAAAVGSQANALNVEVGTLNATVGNDLYVNATNAIRLGAIAATSASIGATGAIADDGDNATRIAAQSLTLSGAAVGAAGAGNEIDTSVDRLSATASAGGIYVGASGDVQLATLSAAGSGNDIVVTTAGAITDDGDAATRISGGTLTLNATSIGAAGAGLGTQVTALNAAASGGGVFVNEADDLQLNTVSGTDVTLTAGGALTDDGNDATRISGTNVSLTAARIGTTDNRIDTAAGSLSAVATAGGVFAAEQDDVALTEVRASGAGNAVDIRTGGNGSMTVQTLVTQGGAVTLTSAGTGSITVTGAIESNNGVVNLISGNALALPGLDTGTGSVTLRTVNDLNVGTITASSVSITSDTGNVSLGTIDATGGTVTVTANNGTITDGDSTSLTARDATLTARTIGGPDQALNLAIDNLTATASAGGIYINDIGSLALNAINANGVISIVTTGALTQNAAIASHGGDIELFAGSLSMRPGATTLSGNGNISYVANGGAISLESLDAGTGRALAIAADSVYSTLDPNAGINNLSGSMVEIRAGGLGGGKGEIGTPSNPINIATPGGSGRSVYLIVPAVNGIQTTTPSINYSGSSASLLLKGYTGATGFLLFDLSSTFSPETILSGDETIVPLLNGRVAVNSDSLSAAKQALSSGVVARINVDWAAFDPNVSLFGTLDPSLRLPADQVDEEVPTASLIPQGMELFVTREGWVLKRTI